MKRERRNNVGEMKGNQCEEKDVKINEIKEKSVKNVIILSFFLIKIDIFNNFSSSFVYLVIFYVFNVNKAKIFII